MPPLRAGITLNDWDCNSTPTSTASLREESTDTSYLGGNSRLQPWQASPGIRHEPERFDQRRPMTTWLSETSSETLLRVASITMQRKPGITPFSGMRWLLMVGSLRMTVKGETDGPLWVDSGSPDSPRQPVMQPAHPAPAAGTNGQHQRLAGTPRNESSLAQKARPYRHFKIAGAAACRGANRRAGSRWFSGPGIFPAHAATCRARSRTASRRRMAR